MRKYFILSLVFSLLLISCTGSDSSVSGTEQVVILHTNDMHAHIDNMAKLAAYKAEVEAEYPNVILVSAGDIFSGNPYVDYYNDKGYPMIDLMNDAGYDISELGNHEFDYGQEILKKRIEQADFPFICANLTVETGTIAQPEPDYVIEKGGLSIYFAGLLETQNEGLPSTHPDKVEGVKFVHAFEVLEDLELNAGEHNAYIALSHLGIETDLRLTTVTDMFDVVIGGHSHTLLKEAVDTNGVMVVQAGDDVEYVGKLVLTFTDGILDSTSYSLINLKDYDKQNEVIAEKIKTYNQNPVLSAPIAGALKDIKGKSELGALFTDAQIEMSDLDFCFQNNGGIRIDKITAGDISMATIFALDPFGNNLMQFEMTPDQIESLIKAGFDRNQEIRLQIGGGSYTVFTDKHNNWKDFEILDNAGNPLDPDKTYKVGLNSYIARSYTFDYTGEGKDLNVTTADNMIAFLKQKKQVDYSDIRRQQLSVK